jgi:nitroimidazol reductase NimA-like FMN-containing flavoprotein (pyridoxamine 5'-phosphate oxidase superfamily)
VSLHEIQEASYSRASRGILSSWPHERSLGAEALEMFLEQARYCVLATTSARGHPQARPVAFIPLEESLWFASGASGRLRNLERMPWVSLVVSEGDDDHHRAVIADGPVTISETAPDGMHDLWEGRFGSRADWAVAWFELRPERLYSYTSA